MNKCIHKYKDQACGYFGTDPGCDKTMEDCVAHENEHRIHIHPHPPKESETGTAWQFVQPHPSGGNCLVSMTEEQAIRLAINPLKTDIKNLSAMDINDSIFRVTYDEIFNPHKYIIKEKFGDLLQ